MGYKTHLLEIYTLPTTLTLHFFYLCYSLKPTARGEWLGYISERWRDFLEGINPKSKAVWSCTFSGYCSGLLEWLFAGYRPKAEGCLELYFFGLSQRVAWGASRSVWKGSRRLSGLNVFSGYISGRWRDFLQRIDQKPKAVWREYFFGVHF